MKNITINEEAYKEFKEFLDENKVESYNIRINLGGYACSGPVFNISVSEATDADVTEVVNDITFIMEKSLVDGCCNFSNILFLFNIFPYIFFCNNHVWNSYISCIYTIIII